MNLSLSLRGLVLAGLAFAAPWTVARDLTVVSVGGALQESFRKAYWQPYATAKSEKLVEDSNVVGLTKVKAMVESGNVIWDLVQMDEEDVVVGCDSGLLEKIDWASAAPATRDLPRELMNPCGVPAMLWAKVLSYDSKRLPDGPKSWADFWDTKRWPGKRALRKQAKQTLEIALMADGVPAAEVYKLLATKAGQDRAFAKLDQIKKDVQWWEAGAQPIEWLASGAVVMASAYNGRIDAANKEGRSLAMVWKNQVYGPTDWVVVKGSPNKAKALALIDYMSAPAQQKLFAETIPYGPANPKAQALLSKAVLDKLPNAPQNIDQPLLQNTAFWADHLDELQQRFAKWVSN
ncbi:spermidine/putrescine ABC transporter substrate-binding protein [Variovorax paradoxus]|jgi:putative spermidine/putrescine transport system substrate-binding protein|uniref:ABC transporter substrate-binding protein n=1 Tax=Variovorax TaxID=34072 RepID=UPI0006E60078|nr:ABC transporter substrate-binding protein [Variovorax sp. CY25R-8]KPU98436.1 spermidine/putrescine ABC transporter substrate-binding protein [Variovorax paradoxus]KPV11892.1 spermidine/putrescine ABC transporter substrate-binding protein [Variovorax paradoxus]KPV13888.1 spermidine/putrescine ABC transporter substrate-binding protein [Variovorax paradoxus]KPV25368.1 spermidine/putrescine ABC transporter substrate-binding protein [Variovorax paradoxus]KPV35696.1 spermidine/putrescine ABC tran